MLPALLLTMLSVPACLADDRLALAEKLLDLAHTSSQLQQGFEIGFAPTLEKLKAQGMPDELIDSLHAEAQKIFAENFKWEEVKPLFAKLYVDNFSEAELRDIIAFYQSSAGQKAIAKIPTLLQQGMTTAMGRVQTKLPELQQRIAALVQDYKKKADAAHKAGQQPTATEVKIPVQPSP